MSPHPTLEPFDSPEEFFLVSPLYRRVEVPPNRLSTAIFKVEFFDGSLTTYCTQCDGQSVFRTDRIQSGELLSDRRAHSFRLGNVWVQELTEHASNFGTDYAQSDRSFTVEFYCTRDHAHRIYFAFAVRGGYLYKMGQFPSLSDFEGQTLERYRKILGKPLSAAYTRAVNLYAHDVGAGSFVYLRRILEHLLEDARQLASQDAEWDEDEYRGMRVVERIKALKNQLPAPMVEHASVYAILSRGVHELSEQECLEHFPAVRTAIDMILDERFAEQQRQLKNAEIARALARISGGKAPE